MKTVIAAIVTVMNVSYLLGTDTLAIKLLTEFSIRCKNQYVRDFYFQKQLHGDLVWKTQHWLFCIMVKMKHWYSICMEIYVKIIKFISPRVTVLVITLLP